MDRKNPAARRIPVCEPFLGGREWEYVKECLDTNWVSTAGGFVRRLEELATAYVGARHAVAAASGTAALHVALLVAGIEPGDEVLVPSLTFIAPANAVRYAGAWPVFIDVETAYAQMDPGRIADFIAGECRAAGGRLVHRATGRRVRGILPVDLLGHPADMDAILALAREHGLVVIEDATESLGGVYRAGGGARRCGALGHIACLSFNGNKIITCGGGGMILTDRQDWADRARYLTTQAKDDPVEFVHEHVGYNYRLTNLQSALGCAQFERLGEHVAAKRRIASAYRQALCGVPGLEVMGEAPWAESAFWMSAVRVTPERYGMDSRALLRRLATEGIETRPLWQPLHLSPAHRDAQRRTCPAAEDWYRRTLCLPCSVGLTPADQARVIAACKGGNAP